jgi:hypothetical protein
MSPFAKFREAASRVGHGNAWLLAASRLLALLFGQRVRIFKYYFMAQPIAGMGTARPRGGTFDLRWVHDGCPLFSQIERPSSVISARFTQGARCLAAVANESELAGFLWFTVGPYEEDEVRARFCPEPIGGSAWDFDVWVLPRYRMGRLLSYLWGVAGAQLTDEGVGQTLSRISAFNAESLASHRRMGGRVVGEAVFLCVGRWQLTKCSLAPKWHLSWRDDQRPEIHVGAERHDHEQRVGIPGAANFVGDKE